MRHGLVSALASFASRVTPASATRFAPLAPLAGLALAALVLAVPACSGSTKASGPTCDSSQCAAGNACIDDGSVDATGKPLGPTCHLVCTTQAQCPFNYTCNDGTLPASQNGPGQPANWCVENTLLVSQANPGLWGTPCVPSDGEGTNKACDQSQGFACYGQTPTDANAYCTQFNCQADTDCPGGWWCETVDAQPNVLTAKRSLHKTRTVCRPRQYCATCLEDHDCPVDASGTAQHCVADPNGDGNSYCAPGCKSDANCPLDATCGSAYPVCTPAQGAACKSDDDCPPQNGTFAHCLGGSCTPECGSQADCASGQSCGSLDVCRPRAGLCKGDGSFCSPCRSDADCATGVCEYAAYSTERYCSVPMSSGTCPPDTTGQGIQIEPPPKGTCPAAPAGSPASDKNYGAIGCTNQATSLGPANTCLAMTSISDGQAACVAPPGTDCVPVPGCWTANRH